jgi:phosphoribosyl 1,2-cyclic phosphate phosphodiesterase
VWEALNHDFRGWPPERRQTRTTPIYLPERVARDFETYLGIAAHLEFLQERQGTVRVHEVPDGETIDLDGATITPIRLAEEYVYAYLFEGNGQRVLVAMDELHRWEPPDLGPLDLAYLPIGIHEHDPFTGDRAVAAEHPVLRFEATYAQTLEIVRALDARRVVLSHVEHNDGLSHDDLVRLGTRDGWEPAYDTMLVDV